MRRQIIALSVQVSRDVADDPRWGALNDDLDDDCDDDGDDYDGGNNRVAF